MKTVMIAEPIGDVNPDAMRKIATGEMKLEDLDSLEYKNQRFEELLAAAARENLKPDLLPEAYIRFTLDRLWNGKTFECEDGTERYHEIGSRFTKSGNPIVIRYE